MTNDSNYDSPTDKKTLLEFPCEFPIKIMGKASDKLKELVVEVVKKHAPDFDPATLTIKESKEGKFHSITATITAESKKQLDAIYQELTSNELVLMAL